MAEITEFETEQQKAARHKLAIEASLALVVVACEAARKDGFFVEFAVNLDHFGRYAASPVGLVKRF